MSGDLPIVLVRIDEVALRPPDLRIVSRSTAGAALTAEITWSSATLRKQGA
jgi:hypothetical protein